MEVRRALLLFAIVLGLAAIAGSVANPPDGGEETATAPQRPATAPSAEPAPPAGDADAVTVRFAAGRPDQSRQVEQGRPLTVLVKAESPSEVRIPSLGLIEPADPLTPARFEILATEPGEHEIVVQPAEPGAERSTVGSLEIVPER